MNRILSTAALMAASSLAIAQESNPPGLVPTPEDADNVVRAPGYSPYAGRYFPTNVYWGDTHVHTDNSLDAKGFGARLDVEDAYRFARGEEVMSNTGIPFRLSRPLDWLVVADHSDGMGAMKEIIKGNPRLISDPEVRGWYEAMTAGGDDAFEATMDVINSFSQGNVPAVVLDEGFQRSVWEDYIETAEAYNEPGTFTTIIGYEWTSTEDGLNLHRNVLYRDNGDVARRVVPYTTAESFNPEDLWKWMANYEQLTGGRVLTLAHNGNMSNGTMFPVEVNPATGRPLGVKTTCSSPHPLGAALRGDPDQGRRRDPSVPVTDDEFADFETLALGNLNLTAVKEDDMLQYEYAREALKNGLADGGRSTAPTPTSSAWSARPTRIRRFPAWKKNNYIGKHAGTEPAAGRWNHPMAKFAGRQYDGYAMSASGYAAVWASENTRAALWDAMMRKEVYATTGPRIVVRFFGGWNFDDADANSRLPAEAGYSKGVPMGGDLYSAPDGASPTFLIAALKDSLSGNLDRIQVVKGWVDARGDTYEKVYNVVWADTERRSLDANGNLPAVGNTVDVENATWTNTIGDPELITVWEDPDFDPGLRAFYYLRVLEIPTPRWTAYDAKRYSVDMPAEVPMTIQERAYSSPIWYTP